MKVFIDGRMPARSSSDDRGSSLRKLDTQRKSRFTHRLPGGGDGELRTPCEEKEFRLFKMRRRIEARDFADNLAGGPCGVSKRRRREGRAARNYRIPIIL